MSTDLETLASRAGELFLLAFAGSDPAPAQQMIRNYHLSGLYLSNDNIPDTSSARALTKAVQETARDSGEAFPLLLGVDQEGTWSVMATDSHPGPGNLALGAAGDPELTHARYRDLALELRQNGLNLLLAPCADVNTNPHNAIIGMRSFGTHPEAVGKHVAAAVQGARSGGALSTIKHFPGHGDTLVDSHRDLPTVSRSREDVWDIDLAPFRCGIEAGVDLVMTSHICFDALDPDTPATFSRKILHDLLRKEMGFSGLVISDSMNMHSLRKHFDPVEAAVRAISAGVDLIMLAEEHYDHDGAYQTRQRQLIEGLAAEIRKGRIPEARLEEALNRIQAVRKSLSSATPDTSADFAQSAIQAARRALRVHHQNPRWRSPQPGATVRLIRSSPDSAFLAATQTRGIGPNPQCSAFDALHKALEPHFSVHLQPPFAAVSQEDPVVLVLENYTLPGADFDRSRDPEVIRWAQSLDPAQVTVIALRDAFELVETHPLTTLCAYSFREESAEQAALWLAGQVPEVRKGGAFG